MNFRVENFVTIMQTCPCNEDPITPHFYIVKLGFTGVFIMAPTLKKWGSILVSACAFVRSFVRLFVLPSVQKKIQARVLKFHVWIPRQKIAYPYFFLV